MKRQAGTAGPEAVERLNRHAKAVATDKEYRDLNRTDGTGGYFVPPLWLMNQFIELARAGRAYANVCPTEALPPGTDSLNIPKVNTGTSTAVQTGDNVDISETDLTDTSVRADVKTIAGQQGLALQLLEQSPVMFDQIIFRDLAADYATKLDLQVIAGSGSGNQVTGVRNTSGIQTISASTTGTVIGDTELVWKKIADAIQRVHTSRFQPAEVIVMHPRRWAWLESALDANGRPLLTPTGNTFNVLGVAEGVVSQQVVGSVQGLPVVTDPSLPTTLGTGTNQDVIHVLRASDLMLFESTIRTRTMEQTRADSLTILLQVYGYLAFTAGRHPESVVEIGGSALAAPSFT